jgi:hypothetical protein
MHAPLLTPAYIFSVMDEDVTSTPKITPSTPRLKMNYTDAFSPSAVRRSWIVRPGLTPPESIKEKRTKSEKKAQKTAKLAEKKSKKCYIKDFVTAVKRIFSQQKIPKFTLTPPSLTSLEENNSPDAELVPSSWNITLDHQDSQVVHEPEFRTRPRTNESKKRQYPVVDGDQEQWECLITKEHRPDSLVPKEGYHINLLK